MKRRYYNVAPRYTPGSPAQVPFETAIKVVDEERKAYEPTIEGAYGAERRAEAQEAGLAGIVEERDEKADCWLVTDMITGVRFIRLFPSSESADKRRARAFRLAGKYHLHVEDEK